MGYTEENMSLYEIRRYATDLKGMRVKFTDLYFEKRGRRKTVYPYILMEKMCGFTLCSGKQSGTHTSLIL